MDWSRYFAMMADWKRLPAYRAEPRVDSLVGYYLPDFASEVLGEKMVGIIPELPIRLGTVKPAHEGTNYADRSYKVDFYLLGASGLNYFVEFKTDSGSRRTSQDAYLEEARGCGMASIVAGIRRIAGLSAYQAKYQHLLNKLSRLGLITEAGLYSGLSDSIEVVFVQPSSEEGNPRSFDFARLATWLEGRTGADAFEGELAAALRRWGSD